MLSPSRNSKNAKRARSRENDWESRFRSVELQEHSWKACVVWIVPQAESLVHKTVLGSLVNIINAGTRRRFVVVTRECLDAEIATSCKTPKKGKPDGKKKQTEVPEFIETCEVAKSILDTGGELPSQVLANLLKFKLLCIKRQDQKQKQDEAKKAKEQKEREAIKQKKLEKVQKLPALAAETVMKKDVKIKRRTDIEEETKYVDDEPENGPEMYIIIAGFSDPTLIVLLHDIKVAVDVVIKLATDLPRSFTERSEIDVFWTELDKLMAGYQSRMPDIVLKTCRFPIITIKESGDVTNVDDVELLNNISTHLFNYIAKTLYDVVDCKRQYEKYKSSTKFFLCDDSGGESVEAKRSGDLRHYEKLLESVVQQNANAALVLDFLIEQVVSTEEASTAVAEDIAEPEKEIGAAEDETVVAQQKTVEAIDTGVAESVLASSINKLKEQVRISTGESQGFWKCKTKEEDINPKIIRLGDNIAMRNYSVSLCKASPSSSVEKKFLHDVTPMSLVIQTLPKFVSSGQEAQEREIRYNQVQHFLRENFIYKGEIDYILSMLIFETLKLSHSDSDSKVCHVAINKEIPWDDPFMEPLRESMFLIMPPGPPRSASDNIMKRGDLSPHVQMEAPHSLSMLISDAATKAMLQTGECRSSQDEGAITEVAKPSVVDTPAADLTTTVVTGTIHETDEVDTPRRMSDAQDTLQVAISNSLQKSTEKEVSQLQDAKTSEIKSMQSTNNTPSFVVPEKECRKIVINHSQDVKISETINTQNSDTQEQKSASNALTEFGKVTITHSEDDTASETTNMEDANTSIVPQDNGKIAIAQSEDAKSSDTNNEQSSSSLANSNATPPKRESGKMEPPQPMKTSSKVDFSDHITAIEKNQSKRKNSDFIQLEGAVSKESIRGSSGISQRSSTGILKKVSISEGQSRRNSRRSSFNVRFKNVSSTEERFPKARDLSEWCWLEQFDKDTLIQVLNDAAVQNPCCDVYWQRRNDSLLLTLHNLSGRNKDRVVTWDFKLHSNIGFRNYLQHVTSYIKDWIEEDLVVQKVMQEEKQKQEEEEERIKEELEKQILPPYCVDDAYIGKGSLKERKREQEVKEAKEALKESRKEMLKESKKEGKKESLTESKKESEKESKKGSVMESKKDAVKEKEKNALKEGRQESVKDAKQESAKENETGSKFSSKRSNSAKRKKQSKKKLKEKPKKPDEIRETDSEATMLSKPSETRDMPPKTEVIPDMPPKFLGYELGNRFFKGSGRRQTMFPCDGARIIIDTLKFISEVARVKVSIMKDSHRLSLYPESAIQENLFVAYFNNELCFAYSLHDGPVILKKPPPPPVQTIVEDLLSVEKHERGKSQHRQKKRKGNATKSSGVLLTKSSLTSYSPCSMTQTPTPVVEPTSPTEEETQHDCKQKRLTISCPNGMYVQFIPLVDADKQKSSQIRLSYTCNNPQLTEACRYIMTDGRVISLQQNESVKILYPDGCLHLGDLIETEIEIPETEVLTENAEEESHVRKKIEKNYQWLFTNRNGQRTKHFLGETASLDPVMMSIATDPQTKDSLLTRDDKVLTLAQCDGIRIVQHADGTRFTILPQPSTWYGKDEFKFSYTIKIETPSFATVYCMPDTKEMMVIFGDDSAIMLSAEENYIFNNTHIQIHLGTDGHVTYKASMCRTSRSTDYEMSLTDSVCCTKIDFDDNEFIVQSNGEVEINPGRPSQDLISVHFPRYFLIDADGTGSELLREGEITLYLEKVMEDKMTAVVESPIYDTPNAKGMSVLTPIIPTKWDCEYTLKTLVPAGLQCRDFSPVLSPEEIKDMLPPFGTNVGAGLNIGGVKKRTSRLISKVRCPEALALRQLVRFPQITPSTRDAFKNAINEFQTWMREGQSSYEKFAQTDPRSDAEKKSATRLCNVLHPTEGKKAEMAIMDAYVDKLTPPPAPPAPVPQPKMTEADWEAIWAELKEEQINRLALRYHLMPPYFHSEAAESFYLKIHSSTGDSESSAGSSVPSSCSSGGTMVDFPIRPENPTPTQAMDSRVVFGSPQPPERSQSCKSVKSKTITQLPPLKTTPRRSCRKYDSTSENFSLSKITSLSGFSFLDEPGEIQLKPTRVSFGAVPVGHLYKYNVVLRNTGTGLCRFRVNQPPTQTGLAIVHPFTPLASGMSAILSVQLNAVNVGTVWETIIIRTNYGDIKLPVMANVVVQTEMGQMNLIHGVKIGRQSATNM